MGLAFEYYTPAFSQPEVEDLKSEPEKSDCLKYTQIYSSILKYTQAYSNILKSKKIEESRDFAKL